jgi:hypothetical protein
MTGEPSGPSGFAIGNDEQYHPVQAVGDQRLEISGEDGANRLDRGLRYHQHVRGLARAAGLPARHRLIKLTEVGHAAGDVLAAAQIREVIFGRPPGARGPGSGLG